MYIYINKVTTPLACFCSAKWKKALRAEHSVVLRIDRAGGRVGVKLSGRSEAVEAAAAAVAELGPISVRRLTVDDAQTALLIGR